MQTLFAPLIEHFVATAILTGAVFVGLVFLLQRERTVSTFAGMGVTIMIVLSGPLHFVRDALQELAKKSSPGMMAASDDPQMLIKRMLSAVRLGIVLFALALISAGIVRGWDAMVPERAVVEAYRSAVREKAVLDSVIPQRDASVAALDAAWSRDSARWVQAYADSLRQRIDRNDRARAAIRQQMLTRPAAARLQFDRAFAELDPGRAGWPDDYLVRSYDSRVSQLLGSLRGLDVATLSSLGFQSRDSVVLRDYLARWTDQRVAERQLAGWGRSDVRVVLQPEYGPQVAELGVWRSRQAQLEAELPGLREQRKWRPLRLALAALGAVVSAFVAIWSAGLLLQAANLVFELAVGATRYFRYSRIALSSEKLASVREQIGSGE